MNNAGARFAGLLDFLKGALPLRLRLILSVAAAVALIAAGARSWLNRWIVVPMAETEALRCVAFVLAAAVMAVTVALVGTSLPALAHHEDTAPTGLSARIVDGGVMLRWSPPAEDATSVDGYEILRRRPNRGEQSLSTLVSDTDNTDTTYTDTTATEPGVRYTYRVKAIRGGVRSPSSHYATVLLPPPALATPPLVSSLGQSATTTTTTTQQYAMGFRLGSHGQGYEISGVSIDLAAAPTDLTVSLWDSAPPGNTHSGAPAFKLFDFINPAPFEVGLNRFTAPEGAFAYQNVNHFIVLSGYSSLAITETTSDNEDPGGETGAILLPRGFHR